MDASNVKSDVLEKLRIIAGLDREHNIKVAPEASFIDVVEVALECCRKILPYVAKPLWQYMNVNAIGTDQWELFSSARNMPNAVLVFVDDRGKWQWNQLVPNGLGAGIFLDKKAGWWLVGFTPFRSPYGPTEDSLKEKIPVLVRNITSDELQSLLTCNLHAQTDPLSMGRRIFLGLDGFLARVAVHLKATSDDVTEASKRLDAIEGYISR